MTSLDYKVAVIVATFGSPEWEERGDWTAGQLHTQTTKPAICRHHQKLGTLSEARNEALIYVLTEDWYEDTEWVVFLDGDDQLDDRFCEAVASYEGDADILHTSVRGFRTEQNGMHVEFIEDEPVFHAPKQPLIRQNYLIIGSPVRRRVFHQVGGFDDWSVLEDWAFWLKCELAGAVIGDCPEAVYFINDDHQRNKHPDIDLIAREIRDHYK